MSGEGAAAKGGRFNPIGVPALYLALTVEGMLLEMGHGFARRFRPLTICSYEIDVEGIVDLSTADGRLEAQVDMAMLDCAWAYERAYGRVPASWTVARRLIDQGAAGNLAPSFAVGARPDMANLVLWRWGPALPHKAAVFDPDNRLPRSPASWTGADRDPSMPARGDSPVDPARGNSK